MAVAQSPGYASLVRHLSSLSLNPTADTVSDDQYATNMARRWADDARVATEASSPTGQSRACVTSSSSSSSSNRTKQTKSRQKRSRTRIILAADRLGLLAEGLALQDCQRQVTRPPEHSRPTRDGAWTCMAAQRTSTSLTACSAVSVQRSVQVKQQPRCKGPSFGRSPGELR
jgi:hypothetical protein